MINSKNLYFILLAWLHPNEISIWMFKPKLSLTNILVSMAITQYLFEHETITWWYSISKYYYKCREYIFIFHEIQTATNNVNSNIPVLSDVFCWSKKIKTSMMATFYFQISFGHQCLVYYQQMYHHDFEQGLSSNHLMDKWMTRYTKTRSCSLKSYSSQILFISMFYFYLTLQRITQFS